MKKINLITFLQFAMMMVTFLFLSACNTPRNFVKKSEKQLEAMEGLARRGAGFFAVKQYDISETFFDDLSKERTVSQGLYEREKISILLVRGKYDEAHELLLKVKTELDTVTDKKSSKKAKSLWHGEVNKVYKGDPYDRCTLHALLAMSFLRRGDAENALACVKGGLLYDADTEKQQFTADYALLHYLGAISAFLLNDQETANQYYNQALAALSQRDLAWQKTPDGVQNKGTVFEEFGSADAMKQMNTLLVFWVGSSPKISRTGKFEENRVISPGYMSLNSMTINVDHNPQEILLPRLLADLNFQALTRGKSMMNDIVQRKAAWKTVINWTSTALFTVGTALTIAGARSGQIYLLAAGGGCVVAGGIGWIVAYYINPKADIRYWKNLPSEFVIKPLKLTPGKHKIRLNGYYRCDLFRSQDFEIEVKPDLPLNVIHLHIVNPAGHNAYYGRAADEKTRAAIRQTMLNSIVPSRFLLNSVETDKAMRAYMALFAASKTSTMDYEISLEKWTSSSFGDIKNDSSAILQRCLNSQMNNMYIRKWEE